MNNITSRLLHWYNKNKRDLPWRLTKDPYSILISEIMLQQTRVNTVIDYYIRFLKRFPDVQSLAAAEEDEVLTMWKGLGYYGRARNLQKAVKQIMDLYDGVFPRSHEQVLKLPGVGEYTAGAITSIAFGEPCPAVDGNVLRVISRVYGISEVITLSSVKKQVTDIVKELIPSDSPGDFTQSLMELGALVCLPKTPTCSGCPLSEGCYAFLHQRTDCLPLKKKKEKPKEQELFALLVIHKDSILMTRQSPYSVLKNMWGVPLLEACELTDAQKQASELIGMPIHEMKLAGYTKHIFTHRIWNMEVFVCEAPVPYNAKPGYEWIHKKGLQNMPVPKAFQKVLDFAPIHGDGSCVYN